MTCNENQQFPTKKINTYGSLGQEGGSSTSLNSDPELDRLLPMELGFPPDMPTDIRVAEEEEEPREEGVAMILSSSRDFTSVVEGGFVDRGRLPLLEEKDGN